MRHSENRQSNENGSVAEDGRLAAALEQFAAAVDAGHPPDRQEFLARHPDIAADLAECLDGLEFVQAAADPLLSDEESAPVSPPSDLVGGTPLGDFRPLREVGRGGMGIVYEAEQLSLRRRVALKVLPLAAALDTRHLERFKNEAHAAAQLHHTHIVPVFAVGCERGVHYYAMQFIDGQSLAALIQDLRERCRVQGPRWQGATHSATASQLSGSNPPADLGELSTKTMANLPTDRSLASPVFFRTVARLGVQAAQALEHAHQIGVVHRDIKPGNLLIDARGSLWITDFGLAQIQAGSGLTQTGDLLGTLRYMSPEQALGKRALIDHRTDVYSLGATLYELLTLRPVFDGRDREEVLRRITLDEPRSPRRLNAAIPPELETIIRTALEKEPQHRYASAADMAEDLERFLDDRPIRARPPSLRRMIAKWLRRHRGVAVTAASGAVAALVLSALALAVNNINIRKEKERTQEARLRAERNLDLALQTLDRIYLRLVESHLPRDARAQADEHQLAELALDFYAQAAAQNDNDAHARAAAARAWTRIGALQTLVGKHEEAERAYAHSVALAESLPADGPDDRARREDLARAHHGLAETLRQTSRGAGAQGHYEKALQLRGQLVGEAPNDPTSRRELAATHNDFGMLLAENGDRLAAEEHYRQALALEDQPLSECPGNPEYQRHLAGTRGNLANLLRDLGRTGEAEDLYRQTLDALAALAQQFPDIPLIRHRLARAYRSLGILVQSRNREEAGRQYRQALDHLDKLVKEFPAVPEYQYDLAITHESLAILGADGGDSTAAASHFHDALEFAGRLATGFPTTPRYRWMMAGEHINLGKLLQERGDLAGAADHCGQAANLMDRLAADFPALPDYQEHRGAAHHNLGDILEQRHDPAGAEKHYREAITARGRLVADHPSVPRYRADLAYSHRLLGDLLAEKGDATAAEHFRKALKLWNRLADDLAVKPARDDSRTLHDLAYCLAQCPDHRFRDSARAVRAAEKAVNQAPDNWLYWSTLGLAQYRAGNAKEALTALQKATALHGSQECAGKIVLAMANWQMGEKAKARKHLAEVTHFLAEHPIPTREVRSLRAEAEELIRTP